MRSIKNKAISTLLNVHNRAGKLAKDRRGSSEIVAVVGLIIVVVVILTVIFFPQIKLWFSSVMSSLGKSTTNLFSLT